MRVAQRLYEGIAIDGETVGLITYMRTDGVQIAEEAITAIRKAIGSDYGQSICPTLRGATRSRPRTRRRPTRRSVRPISTMHPKKRSAISMPIRPSSMT